MTTIKLQDNMVTVCSKLKKYSSHIMFTPQDGQVLFVIRVLFPIEWRNYVPCIIEGHLTEHHKETVLTYRVLPTWYTIIKLGVIYTILISILIICEVYKTTPCENIIFELIAVAIALLGTLYDLERIRRHKNRFHYFIQNKN